MGVRGVHALTWLGRVTSRLATSVTCVIILVLAMTAAAAVPAAATAMDGYPEPLSVHHDASNYPQSALDGTPMVEKSWSPVGMMHATGTPLRPAHELVAPNGLADDVVIVRGGQSPVPAPRGSLFRSVRLDDR